MSKALILVDIQNDFLPGGALAVPGGSEVIAVANRVIGVFDLVVATQDWHPHDHLSFASQHPGRSVGDLVSLGGLDQVLWPDHCVQGSPGANFASDLNVNDSVYVFTKGTDRQIDSYSGFFDNGHKKATGLGDFLREKDTDEVYVMGLATDYCVKFTALDARELGFETHLIVDGCRGVDLKTGDVDQAIEAMRDTGVNVTSSGELQVG